MRKNHLMGAFAAFVLAAALLLSFVGCADKNDGDQTVTTPSAATDTADVTTSFDPFAHLGDNDSYRGSEFCILNGCVASWFTRNSVVSEELDGDPISYAITRGARSGKIRRYAHRNIRPEQQEFSRQSHKHRQPLL